MKVGDKVVFLKRITHPKQEFSVGPGINATVLDRIDHVLMVLPHNCGHEMIVTANDVMLSSETA
jgi:hypothetical protein